MHSEEKQMRAWFTEHMTHLTIQTDLEKSSGSSVTAKNTHGKLSHTSLAVTCQTKSWTLTEGGRKHTASVDVPAFVLTRPTFPSCLSAACDKAILMSLSTSKSSQGHGCLIQPVAMVKV